MAENKLINVMSITYQNGNVIAQCPSCNGSLTTFERVVHGKPLGDVVVDKIHQFEGISFPRIIWTLMRCASCGYGGMAEIHASDDPKTGKLGAFYPNVVKTNKLSTSIPEDIKKEYREAEKCYSFKAYRAASALVRSVLEKTLKVNGYNSKSNGLERKIELAGEEGIISAALSKKAHDKIKILGDDVLHEDWREVAPGEAEESLNYALRILEAFYDDRETVFSILKSKKRINDEPK